MRVELKQLELDLLVKIRLMVVAAKLPSKLTWPTGVKVKDLAKTGSCMDRFNDGKFQVEKGENAWILDGGVTEEQVSVVWSVQVEVDTGAVVVFPKLATTQVGGRLANLTEELGFAEQAIGKVGPLVQMFPATTKDLLIRYQLPNLYSDRDSAERDRKLLTLLLNF